MRACTQYQYTCTTINGFLGSIHAGFYKGRIGAAIVDVLQKDRGVMMMDDLAQHRSVRTRPIHTSYRGYTIYEVPPPTQVGPPAAATSVSLT